MLTVDLPISKRYWQPFFDFIVKKIQREQFTQLKGVPVLRMEWGKRILYVAVKRKGVVYEVVGWLYLGHPKKDWVCWQVEQSYIFKKFRGQGWGKVLYKTVIDREGLILASGTQQTKSARTIWRAMVAKDHYTVWAHDFATEKLAAVGYDADNDELWCSLQLYEDKQAMKQGSRVYPKGYSSPEWVKRDVRLIAIRKEQP